MHGVGSEQGLERMLCTFISAKGSGYRKTKDGEEQGME